MTGKINMVQPFKTMYTMQFINTFYLKNIDDRIKVHEYITLLQIL